MVRFLSHGFQHYLVDVGVRATRRKKTFGEAMNLQMIRDHVTAELAGEPRMQPLSAAD
jgi:hypothetical protein